ncbi:MAG: phage regulatory protein/antirepressor Ant [Bacteroidaceae bacterium]|nr:phage regulatory protein/antirepressor Ant [Bacteroidaceae bacterium]
MERDLIQFGESKQTMSSLEIAELTGKPHNDVMKAIRAMESSWEKVSQGKFSLSSRKVQQPNGGVREYPCYELTKTECLYVATKFNDEARAKLVLRWEELEQKQRAQMLQLPDFTDPAEAAMAWAKEYREKKVLAIENKKLEEENIQLAAENQELKHDKNYLDLIMRSKALLTVSQIAQDYGMSGKALNKKLADMGIQYSINGQWILYARYKDCGYVSSRSIDITRADGRPDVVLHTEWTQAGRKFLYEELKKQGIIPMLERD